MDSSKGKGVIENEKQENVKKVEALSLASKKLEDERKDPPSKLKKINLAVNRKEMVILIAKNLEKDFELSLVALLKEYQDIFVWSYRDMPGLSTSLITHKLAIDPTIRPVKQVARNFSNEI